MNSRVLIATLLCLSISATFAVQHEKAQESSFLHSKSETSGLDSRAFATVVNYLGCDPTCKYPTECCIDTYTADIACGGYGYCWRFRSTDDHTANCYTKSQTTGGKMHCSRIEDCVKDASFDFECITDEWLPYTTTARRVYLTYA